MSNLQELRTAYNRTMNELDEAAKWAKNNPCEIGREDVRNAQLAFDAAEDAYFAALSERKEQLAQVEQETLAAAQPVAKRPLSDAERAARSKGGQAVKAKYGTQHLRAIGRKGYERATATYGNPGWHVMGGMASWNKQNAEMIRSGSFPNQSLKQWGYK